ncbi:muskelin isoform X3 [Anopheles ziemanni]|uniref:muskelin isoform X3 n=1 Tax=Anopheles coustani TaxID=139045 RepID=UPI002657CF4D|nr:muskelin isoform X3 [Anopheles coustani]XP_058167988.1 muskelin isoform X3 [Anopheles ziemanni]
MAGTISDIKKLEYDIYKYSSYSSSYLPENIREDNPSNQTSRWSSNTNTPPQFLILKLERPAIVTRIKFGKYEKTHVCNLRKFRILGGLEEERMVLLFEGGLRNDAVPETFNLKHRTNSGELLPIKFVQIVPLLSWGPSFNFCIWYVELLGIEDSMFILSNLRKYNMLREVEIVRLFLKHCRQQGYSKTFRALQEETGVRLEDEQMTELHEILVNRGDFKKTEEMLMEFIDNGLMDHYLAKQEYKPQWSLQLTPEKEPRPGRRGGHQLVIDQTNSTIYLYGGWDGNEDLSDLWSYDVKSNRWTLIHERSELLDGPTPRACHKMVYDTRNGQIFMLGRYLDSASRTEENINSDFYLYNTISREWYRISSDTSQDGGPKLVFDHQMCIDVDKQTIYVFGGRILEPNYRISLSFRNEEETTGNYRYSGLFSYHISTNTWTHIMVDCDDQLASSPHVHSIRSRVTHSMLFHHKHRKLYIFGGQRGKDYMTDFLIYDVDTNELSNMTPENNNTDTKNVPQSGFTQRATIDSEKDEIYVLTSLSKEKERRDLNINSFWLFSLAKKEWCCVYKSEHSNGENCYQKSSQHACHEPCPRYAHQIVYDGVNQVHFLFGGNPGTNSNVRLDDFWVLRLEKPNRANILRYCKYLLRKQEYEEITKNDPLAAILYLQTKLYDIIDHSDPVQLKEFHKLASLLFKSDTVDGETEPTSLLTCSLSGGAGAGSVGSSVGAGVSAPAVGSGTVTTAGVGGGGGSKHKQQRSDDDRQKEEENMAKVMRVESPKSLADEADTSSISSMSSSDCSNSQGPGTSAAQRLAAGTTATDGAGSSPAVSVNPTASSKATSSTVDDAGATSSTSRSGNSARNRSVDQQFEMKIRRCLLFNKLVDLMPEALCQPKKNISDFVLL